MYNGILILDKPQGFTSHDAVAKLRGIFRQKKIGHGGTLDPMATGVLPVFLGTATRAAEYISSSGKRYIAKMRLGISTDTQDITGVVTKTFDVNVGKREVIAALAQFRGEISQIPPMYSAVWKNGRRLYDLARQGIEVERQPRTVNIERLEILECHEDEYTIDVTCSKGTYIRTLCSDIGDKLGCCAVMTSLRRIRAGIFGEDRAVGFSELESAAQNNSLEKYIIPVDMLFCGYPSVTLKQPPDEKRALNGAPVILKSDLYANIPPSDRCRVYDSKGKFIMLGKTERQNSEQTIITPEKMFLCEG